MRSTNATSVLLHPPNCLKKMYAKLLWFIMKWTKTEEQGESFFFKEPSHALRQRKENLFDSAFDPTLINFSISDHPIPPIWQKISARPNLAWPKIWTIGKKGRSKNFVFWIILHFWFYFWFAAAALGAKFFDPEAVRSLRLLQHCVLFYDRIMNYAIVVGLQCHSSATLVSQQNQCWAKALPPG